MVYPTSAMGVKERGVPFGLITIPKLECCGGNCGCPDGSCSCGKLCDGCCSEHLHARLGDPTSVVADVEKRPAVRVISAPAQSCCGTS